MLKALVGNNNVALLDTFTLVDQVTLDPSAYGLSNATEHCLLLVDPFICATPDTYMFWDGIHPTRAFHAIVKDAALGALGL